jgi:hypothetical protein
MVLIYGENNDIKIFFYNDYSDKQEFWNKVINYKFNNIKNNKDEKKWVNKIDNQINKLIRK